MGGKKGRKRMLPNQGKQKWKPCFKGGKLKNEGKQQRPLKKLKVRRISMS